MSEIKSNIRGFLGRYIQDHTYTDDTNVFAEGFVNSLFAMDLIVFIEKNYHFKIRHANFALI